jgi:peptidoglycan-N-acetylglucosamine deacetylase
MRARGQLVCLPRTCHRSSDAIYDRVIDHAHNGAIIIQHDGGGDRSQTLAALPREIDTLGSQGYRFVTIPQLLGLRLLYK